MIKVPRNDVCKKYKYELQGFHVCKRNALNYVIEFSKRDIETHPKHDDLV